MCHKIQKKVLRGLPGWGSGEGCSDLEEEVVGVAVAVCDAFEYFDRNYSGPG